MAAHAKKRKAAEHVADPCPTSTIAIGPTAAIGPAAAKAPIESSLSSAFKEAVKKSCMQGEHIHQVMSYASVRNISLSGMLQIISSRDFLERSEQETRDAAVEKFRWRCSAAQETTFADAPLLVTKLIETVLRYTESQCEEKSSFLYPVLKVKGVFIPLFKLEYAAAGQDAGDACCILEFTIKRDQKEDSIFECLQRLIGVSSLNPFFLAKNGKQALMASMLDNINHYLKDETGKQQLIQWNIDMVCSKKSEIEAQRNMLAKMMPRVQEKVDQIHAIYKDISDLEAAVEYQECQKQNQIISFEETTSRITQFGGNGEEFKQRLMESLEGMLVFLKNKLESQRQHLHEVTDEDEETKSAVDSMLHLDKLIKSMGEEKEHLEGIKDHMWFIWIDEDLIKQEMDLFVQENEGVLELMNREEDEEAPNSATMNPCVPLIKLMKDIMTEKIIFFDGMYSLKKAFKGLPDARAF